MKEYLTGEKVKTDYPKIETRIIYRLLVMYRLYAFSVLVDHDVPKDWDLLEPGIGEGEKHGRAFTHSLRRLNGV